MKMRLALFLILLGLAAPIARADEWQTNYEQALAAAKAANKNVLLDFTGSDWCGPCIALKSRVLTQPAFQEFAAKNLVLVELDFPRRKELPADVKQQNERLMKQYNVEGFPTIVLLSPDGKVLGQFSGYRGEGPPEFIAKLQQMKGG